MSPPGEIDRLIEIDQLSKRINENLELHVKMLAPSMVDHSVREVLKKDARLHNALVEAVREILPPILGQKEAARKVVLAAFQFDHFACSKAVGSGTDDETCIRCLAEKAITI